MRCSLIQQVALQNTYASAPNRFPSLRIPLIYMMARSTSSVPPINYSESSTSYSWDKYLNSEKLRRYEANLKKTYQVLADRFRKTETDIKTNKKKSKRFKKKSKQLSKAHRKKGRNSDKVQRNG
ncbi:hypothetical protein I79_000352 [Cricetulus griseus]|uniref:Uncharacterized protein n=1 Tax=Cricetulus griseus TaxID=10029 RepID=G3GS42_CRIGR|nr:hypothetical protein I79_000352 [Cricetulus griseus]ERE66296.1 hypothetical protein H671_8g19542 [Cricetulus griseus]